MSKKYFWTLSCGACAALPRTACLLPRAADIFGGAARSKALHTIMMKLLALLAALGGISEVASAQDVEYIGAIERAQRQRPAAISTSARIAPASEAGFPMILHGRVVKTDGSGAVDAIVFAYHADREGRYDRREAGPHSWRLRGWAKADQDGRFTFETIRPGPYPDRRTPAHVHFTIFMPSGERYHAGEIRFDDDPLVPQRERDASKQAGDFGGVRTVQSESDVQRVEFALRIDVTQQF